MIHFYNMTDNTEYQANLFAADLLIEDEKIEDMVQNEDLDYFGLCSSLNATPELMSFKIIQPDKNEARLIICRWRFRAISWRNKVNKDPVLIYHNMNRIFL